MMNIFRLAGDMSHLASILVLLFKIQIIKSCAGISLKTQELYAIVFATRYLDLFTVYISLYNTLLKLIFLGSSFLIVWYIRQHKIVRESYDKDQDTFRHYFLVIPCLVLALIINVNFTFIEVMWTFSLFLEAVAILPQLSLLQRTKNIDNLTWQYVFLLGIYRPLYTLNWIYRYNTELYYFRWSHMIAWIPGLVQTLLYAIFFYRYFQRPPSSLPDDCYSSLPTAPSPPPPSPPPSPRFSATSTFLQTTSISAVEPAAAADTDTAHLLLKERNPLMIGSYLTNNARAN